MGAAVRLAIGVVVAFAAVPGAVRAQTACPTLPATAAIVYIGEFTNMRHTAEHSYGFAVDLWRAGDCLIGVLTSSAGLSGDTPIGLIQDVKYDRASGRVSFAAKLTMGVTTPRGSTVYEPSRDFYQFDGRLSANALTGVVTHEQRNHPHIAPSKTEVTLSLAEPGLPTGRAATSYGQWQQEWKPILAARGPKW